MTLKNMTDRHILVEKQNLKLFSQREAEMLSGLTRAQLLKWEEAGIVLPRRSSAILYEWNQLLFLRVIYHLRQMWTFKQIEKAFKANDINLDTIINNIDKTVIIAMGQNEDLIFKCWDSENLGELNSAKEIFDLCNSKNGFLKAEVCGKSVFATPKAVIILVPKLIEEMTKIGEDSEIENFGAKVG
jgi:DNA-binding transcriptional MerR regulator